MIESQEQEWPSRRYAWFVVVVLMTLYIFSFVDRMVIALLVAPIKADLQLSDTSIGLLQGSAFALFYTFVGVFLARLADNWNRTWLIAIGVLLWGMATAFSGFANGFTALFVARMLVGVGEATLSPAAYSLISDYFPPEKRARAMSLYTSGIYFGVGLAFLFGGMVISLVGGDGTLDMPFIGSLNAWRAVFVTVGLPGLFFCIFVLLFVREPARREMTAAAPTTGAFIAFFKTRSQLYLGHYFGFAALVMYGYSFSAWVPTLLIRRYGVSPADAALWVGIVILLTAPAGVMIGSVFAQKLRTNFANGAAMRLGVIASVLALVPAVLFPLMPTFATALVFIGITQFLITLPFGVAPAALHEVTPNQYRGQIIALYLFVINLIGFGTGPLLVGVITDHILGDESALNYSLVIVAAVLLPVSAVLLARATKTFRDFSGNGETN